MRLFFLKDDTFYKIYTTLEKIPKSSQVEIFIETGNQFFHNPRRAKQLNSLVSKRNIQTTFIAENDHQKNFFDDNNINYELKKQSKIRIFFTMLYRFFFNIKKFHLNTFHHKSYSFFAIFGLEILLLLGAGYGIYSLILPESVVTITPSYDINEIVYNFRYLYPDDYDHYPYTGKYITLKMYTGQVGTISAQQSIDKTQQEGKGYIKGVVRVTNTLPTAFDLVKSTQFIDNNGIEYTADNNFYLPRSSGPHQAGTALVSITSKATTENEALIEQHKNDIGIGQEILIKKLGQSLHTKQIYATSVEGFSIQNYRQGSTISSGEIEEFKKNLFNEVLSKKNHYIKSRSSQSSGIILPFDELTSLDDCQYSILGDQEDLSKLRILSGSLQCNVIISYIEKQDIVDGVTQYVSNRSTASKKLIGIQDNIVNFFDLLTGDYHAYIIPTRVNVIESYNLDNDVNHIIPDIKNQIAGKTREEAGSILQTMPEIESGRIRISPFWYNTITTIKSRIHIKIKYLNS